MRGAVAATVVLGLLTSLAGCERKKPVWEDTHHLERPPPQPPRCPELPELKNVTLKDGTVVDVRIVQFRDTKMYFPADLIGSAFIDGKRDEHGFIDSNIVGKQYEGMAGAGYYLRKFDPDIYYKECHGVVHKLVEDSKSLWPLISIELGKTSLTRDPRKNVRPSEAIGAIYFTSHIDPPPSRLATRYGSFNEIFVWKSRLQVMVSVKDADLGKWQHSKSVDDFVNWLATPPAKRNNDAIFMLKVDPK